MKQLILKRISENNDGTFGVLLDEGVPFCLTLEKKWYNNSPNISCIPVGKYTCKRKVSHRFGNTFEVKDVPNRTHILFHKGNVIKDSLGCILLGEKFEPVGDCYGVTQSKFAFTELMLRTINVNEFELEIIDVTKKGDLWELKEHLK